MGRQTKFNKLTSPELLSQVNQENMQLLDDYLNYLSSVDRSNTTIEAYRNDIHIAFVWGLEHNGNKPFVEWTKRNIVAYQNWLINKNENSPARVRRLRASLSSMSNFIENILDDEYPNFRNIINKIEAPVNKPVMEKTVLKDEEVQAILDKLVELKRYETACLVALAAYGGRRKSELCRFKVSDFSDDRLVCGGSLYKSSPMKTKGRGKAGKVICCYTLAHRFKPYLDLWLKEREEKNITSEWLFVGSDGVSQLNTTNIDSWMRAISREHGIDVYAHSFRHYFTTMLSKEGIPDNVIKEIQHWSTIEMVSTYNDLDAEETLDMYFGEEGIKSVNRKGLTDL